MYEKRINIFGVMYQGLKSAVFTHQLIPTSRENSLRCATLYPFPIIEAGKNFLWWVIS
jgi:hypothetical protein